MVAAGSFREDLYFRLAVLPAFVPPLRARRDDIPGLLSHFLSRRPDIVIEPSVLAEVAAHPWTGNVRELRSFVDRAVAVGPTSAWMLTRGEEAPGGSRIPAPPSVPSYGAAPPGLGAVPLDVPFKVLKDRYSDQFERAYLSRMIERIGRDAPAIATAAGLDPTYVRRLLRKHGL